MSWAARLTQKVQGERRRTCSRCNRMGHQATTCTNPETHLDRIGIEIEGFWWDLAAAKRKAMDVIGSQGTSDGSLREVSTCEGGDDGRASDGDESDEQHADNCEDDDCEGCAPTARRCNRRRSDCKVCGARGWEFQTSPGTLGESLRQLTQMYPDVTSRAAGLHVHVSFKDISNITLIASEEFFKFFNERWQAWGTRMGVRQGSAFWERLRGENQYCRVNSMKDWPIDDYGNNYMYINRHNDRYRALNFHAWDEHKTVECRLLPMFQNARYAVAAVEELVAIFDDYLNQVVVDKPVDSVDCPEFNFKPTHYEHEIDASILEATLAAPRTLAPVDGEVEIVEIAMPNKAERKRRQDAGEAILVYTHEAPAILAARSDEMMKELRRRNRM